MLLEDSVQDRIPYFLMGTIHLKGKHLDQRQFASFLATSSTYPQTRLLMKVGNTGEKYRKASWSPSQGNEQFKMPMNNIKSIPILLPVK